MLRIALVALLCACGAANPVTIAVALGPLECDGARLAYEEAVTAGLSYPIDTVFIVAVNTRAAPAISDAEFITSKPGIVAVVGPNNSAASLASAPVYNEREVVQLSTVATAVLYSTAGPFSYRLAPPDDRQGRFIADHVMNNAAGRRVALMYVNDDYGRGLRREVMGLIPPNAINWVMDAPHVEGAHNSAARRVAALVEVRPAFLLFLGRGSELELLLPAIRAQLGDIPIMGSDGVATMAGRNLDGKWNGVRFVDLLDLNATPEIRALRQRYFQRFGREPSVSDVMAYDAMKIIIAAVQAGARSGTDVQQFLDELGNSRPPFQGATGRLHFDAQGDIDRGYVLNAVPRSP